MASEAPKENPTHVEQEGVAAKKTFGQKFKRHCARFWWIHLLILIVIVLVVTLPVVFGAYPHIAQSTINKSGLVVTSQSLLNPAPDAFDIEVNSVFLSNSSMHAQLDAFEADLCLNGSNVPFAQLSIPALEAANGTEEHVSQRVQITNKQQFFDYAKTSLLSEEYVVYLRGKGGLKYGKLQKTTVNYNEKITLKGTYSEISCWQPTNNGPGLNGLKGFNVTDFELITTAQTDGSNANGTVFMPNPSVTTYEMGNLTMDMYTDDILIGNSTLPNVVLKPGNNTLPLRAVVNQTAVVTLLFTKYKCGIFPIDIVSKQTVYNGQDLPYYDQALQANNLTIHLNVIDVLEKAGLASYLGINTTNAIPC